MASVGAFRQVALVRNGSHATFTGDRDAGTALDLVHVVHEFGMFGVGESCSGDLHRCSFSVVGLTKNYHEIIF